MEIENSECHCCIIKQYYDYYQYLEDYYNQQLYDEIDKMSPKLSAAFEDDMGEMYEYYDDDDDYHYYDEYDETEAEAEENLISMENLQDQWVDEEDGSAWIVSFDAVNDYDTEWKMMKNGMKLIQKYYQMVVNY